MWKILRRPSVGSAFSLPGLTSEEKQRLATLAHCKCCRGGDAGRLGKVRSKVAEVKTIAVIGAGNHGRGIAHAAALGGYRTILEDLLPAALRKAGSEIRANPGQGCGVGGKSPRPMPTQLSSDWSMRDQWRRQRAKRTW